MTDTQTKQKTQPGKAASRPTPLEVKRMADRVRQPQPGETESAAQERN